MKEVIAKMYYCRSHRGGGHLVGVIEDDNEHYLINPSKVGVFEVSILWERRWWGKFETLPPPSFIFQEKLIRYQHNSIKL